MTTAKREQLLEMIRRSPGPVSAAEIRDDLARDGKPMGIATVYRILQQERAAGTIEATEFPGAQARYSIADEEHHHHVLCTICDRAFDAPGCPDGIYDIAPPSFRVTGHAILLYGQCHDCQTTQ